MSASTAKHKLQGIEAARGVAASLVVVYHAARHLEVNGLGLPWAAGIEKFGHAGVDFFFVLSGFIILFAHWDDVGVPAALPRYVERRCMRIFPLYWPVLAVSLAAAIFGSRALQPSVGTLLANTLLLPTDDEPVLGVAWTLQHEMLFYALFATLLWSRSLGGMLFATWLAWALAVSCGALDRLDGGFGRVASSAYNAQFALGMAAAWVTRRGRVRQAGWLALLGAASFFAVGIAESRGRVDGYGDFARLLYGVAAWLFVIGLVEYERATSLHLPRLLALLGKASYSVYLVHLLCLGIVYRILERLGATRIDPHLLLAVLVASGIAGGVLVSVWIEYPLMGQARNLWARAAGRGKAVTQ
ncbi:MAG: acyltransferase [Planctomycetes bacterium]|nr:acyltransferase [Planctomycetota bacterium]